MNRQFKAFIIGLVILGSISPWFYLINSDLKPDTKTDTISILTYNVHFGIEPSKGYNIDSIVDFIEGKSPDVVGMQEVGMYMPANGFINMYADLILKLGELGYNYHYISEGGNYYLRNVIFSKFEITKVETYDYDHQYIYHRSLIHTVIDTGNISMSLFTTHLAHTIDQRGNSTRKNQIIEIIDFITQNPQVSTNMVLFGDLNIVDGDPTMQPITDNFNDVWNSTNSFQNGFTSPADNPEYRIDYIFSSFNLNPISCEIFDVTYSDHLPLICNLEI